MAYGSTGLATSGGMMGAPVGIWGETGGAFGSVELASASASEEASRVAWRGPRSPSQSARHGIEAPRIFRIGPPNDGVLQMGLFDERNLFEVTHPDFPNERLVACRNPELAERRRHKRRALLEATCKELEKVCRMVERRRLQGKEDIRAAVKKLLTKYKVGRYYRLDIRDDGFDFELDETTMDADASRLANGNSELANKRLQRWKRHMGTIAKQFEGIRQRIGRGQLHGKDKIGVRVGRVLNKYKVGKHFKLDIRDDSFSFEIDDTKVTTEAALDGIYVIRTSLAEQRMKTDDTVRSYKLLTQVERAFRSFKSMDLKVRPIRHRRENRVRAHVFLCMLAYYVLWHMMEAWRPLLFSDEDQQAKARRDPVAPAKRSEKCVPLLVEI